MKTLDRNDLFYFDFDRTSLSAKELNRYGLCPNNPQYEFLKKEIFLTVDTLCSFDSSLKKKHELWYVCMPIVASNERSTSCDDIDYLVLSTTSFDNSITKTEEYKARMHKIHCKMISFSNSSILFKLIRKI